MRWSLFQLALALLFVSQPARAYTTQLLQLKDRTGNITLYLQDLDYLENVLPLNISKDHDGAQTGQGDLQSVRLTRANSTAPHQTTPPPTVPPENTTLQQVRPDVLTMAMIQGQSMGLKGM